MTSTDISTTRDKASLLDIEPEGILRSGFVGFRDAISELSGKC